jgi:hypothetical protein
MAGRLPQPYRGQPRPKYPKPRRQFRNLREEKLSDTITINLFLFLSITLLVIGMLSSGSGGDALSIGVLIAISFMGLILTAAIADGTKSINKFRNSYDFDASKLEETQADNKSDDEQQ